MDELYFVNSDGLTVMELYQYLQKLVDMGVADDIRVRVESDNLEMNLLSTSVDYNNHSLIIGGLFSR